MKNLEELGLDTSDASMCYATFYGFPSMVSSVATNYTKLVCNEEHIEGALSIIPAYTLQDILDKLPIISNSVPTLQKNLGGWNVYYEYDDYEIFY